MGAVNKILRIFRPDQRKAPGISANGNSKVNNKVLYKELIAHFKEEMEELSVNRRILYPMSFNILLHPDDYDIVGESLPYILPEVVAGFYAAIKQKCADIPGADATNPARYWFFQFASSRVKSDEEGESFIVPGEIVTVGHLTTFDIKVAQQMSATDNIKLSVKCQNSNVNQNNVNQEALLGMDILTNNAFTFNFDKSMSESLADINSSQRGQESAFATLTYSVGGTNIHFSMLDDLLIISGSGESRRMENIMKIDSDAVAVGHVQIRYVEETNRFQICAYSDTRLNMREIPLSTGGVPIWKDMSYNSNIFLNGEINIRFEASQNVLNKE